jgi:hypothetical protein
MMRSNLNYSCGESGIRIIRYGDANQYIHFFRVQYYEQGPDAAVYGNPTHATPVTYGNTNEPDIRKECFFFSFSNLQVRESP